MDFRLAEKKDYAAVAALNKQVFDFHADARPDLHRKVEGQFTRAVYEGWLNDGAIDVMVLAADGGSLLGYAALEWQEAPDRPVFQPRKTVFVRDLVVNEEHRGLGLGSRLMEQVILYARAKGADAVDLNVFECNPSAIRFYERQGFRTKTRIMEFILDEQEK
ncbi:MULTISPECIES: GNAT family N-acetyltransferase [Paenibacillus]|uniref:GNAT family N-acetyltransferase n=1 Tax=Paenibacillus TaxID=44249 RepID=UPI000414AD0A|nr:MULTISPECIES: GNAT family N-acetyltransferase [Paenibacillus]KKC48592.1 hypothetical protein VE23_18340 [Paenibacillus sp. D9]CDN41589.1 Uncharacterized protein BN871_AI_01000 [Paenibacillus sp. P22]